MHALKTKETEILLLHMGMLGLAATLLTHMCNLKAYMVHVSTAQGHMR